jgi:hypothetical protein
METPEELIGKEPSLLELIDYINNYKEFFEYLSLDIVSEYYIASQKDIGSMKDKYFLGGQLVVSINEPITSKIIDWVKNENIKRQLEYGEPYNSFELASIARAKHMFETLQEIIARYYQIQIHELYRPPENGDNGGEIYQKIFERTLIGK